MSTTVFQYIKLEDIKDHPMGNIVRGPIRDTSDLQRMIRADGLLQPLTVEYADGEYYLIAGYRRRHALMRLGETEAPCYIRKSDDSFSLRAMAAANVFEPQPELILDENDNPIGGLAWVVYLEKDATSCHNKTLSDSLGLKVDTIGAYLSLVREYPALRRRFADGDIAITVYSRFKTQPLEVKEYILKKQGVITIGYVRDILKNWDSIAKTLHDDADKDDADREGDDQAEEEQEAYEPAEYPVVQCLNEALQWLHRVDGRGLGVLIWIIGF